jgi:hypothetical protein
MLTSEVEARVYQIIDIVTKGNRVEDERVELKGIWIDAKKAARQVAGHANKLRGEPILWVFGIDEVRGLTGVDPGEFSNWWNQFKSQYVEDVYPALLTHVNVSVESL